MELATFVGGVALGVTALSALATQRSRDLDATRHRLASASNSWSAPCASSVVVVDPRAAGAAAGPPAVSSSPASAATAVEHFPVWHLRDTFADIPSIPNPMASRSWPRNQNFVGENEETLRVQTLAPHSVRTERPPRAFLTAGPLERLAWDPATTRAAVVTCGGLCSGLNTVIQSIVHCLTYVYNVPKGNVLGVLNGYRGFYEYPMRQLTPAYVANVRERAGTPSLWARVGASGDAHGDAAIAVGEIAASPVCNGRDRSLLLTT